MRLVHSVRALPAVALAALLLASACGDDGSSPTPSPTPTSTEPAPSPTPTPAVAPAAFSPGDWVEVVAAEECLDTFLFAPSPVSVPDCVPVPSGFVSLIVGGPNKTEGGPWWPLASWGWVPEQSLRFHHRGEPPYPERPELADIGRIAFIAPDGDVWIMNADGSGKEMLLNLPGGRSGVFRLHWSPDGRKLAVATCDEPPNVLAIVSADGDPLLRLDDICFGAWSPASDAFAATRVPEGGLILRDLVVLDLKGDVLIELPEKLERAPSFSADGRKVAFFEVVDFGYCNEVRAQIVDLQTGEVQPIATLDPEDPSLPYFETPPLWSPNDPSLLAYGRLLINFDAGEERVLPGLAAGWSPDGRFLILSVEDSLHRQVYDIATSSAALEWEFTPAPHGGPCSPPVRGVWSPDGRYLAYFDPDDLSEPGTFSRSLRIWDASSGRSEAILPAPGVRLGAFSPGGQHMLFGYVNDWVPELQWISIMNIGGSDYTLLAEGTEAAWQPQP